MINVALLTANILLLAVSVFVALYFAKTGIRPSHAHIGEAAAMAVSIIFTAYLLLHFGDERYQWGFDPYAMLSVAVIGIGAAVSLYRAHRTFSAIASCCVALTFVGSALALFAGSATIALSVTLIGLLSAVWFFARAQQCEE